LRAALKNPARRPHVVTFTSSSTVRNFAALVDSPAAAEPLQAFRGQECPRPATPRYASLDGILLASIGPVTSSTLRELNLGVDIQAKQFTIPGLVKAIVGAFTTSKRTRPR
jgi:uroporphyrinogen-III synthase